MKEKTGTPEDIDLNNHKIKISGKDYFYSDKIKISNVSTFTNNDINMNTLNYKTQFHSIGNIIYCIADLPFVYFNTLNHKNDHYFMYGNTIILTLSLLIKSLLPSLLYFCYLFFSTYVIFSLLGDESSTNWIFLFFGFQYVLSDIMPLFGSEHTILNGILGVYFILFFINFIFKASSLILKIWIGKIKIIKKFNFIHSVYFNIKK